MQKEFNHNNFKKSVSNVSGFLTEKNINVPYNTLLDALSLFLGVKNWNTLKEQLNKPKKDIDNISLNNNQKISESLFFDDRVKMFLEFIFNDVNDDFLMLNKCSYLSFDDFKKDMLSAATETVFKDSSYLNDFKLVNKGDLFISTAKFECNDSLDDEKMFYIQIAQKGSLNFNSNYLDILFFLYAINNKWFNDYVMGEVNYSYIYNKKINKEVLKIYLPIDSFTIKEFKEAWEGLKEFLQLFYKNINLNLDKDERRSALNLTEAALNQMSHSVSNNGKISISNNIS